MADQGDVTDTEAHVASAAEVRENDAEWEALYDALELTGTDRTPEGAARWARTYVAMARRSGWL